MAGIFTHLVCVFSTRKNAQFLYRNFSEKKLKATPEEANFPRGQGGIYIALSSRDWSKRTREVLIFHTHSKNRINSHNTLTQNQYYYGFYLEKRKTNSYPHNDNKSYQDKKNITEQPPPPFTSKPGPV